MRRQKKYSLGQQIMAGLLVAICVMQPALAGTQGTSYTIDGFGRAVDSVTYGSQVAIARSPYMQNPCARVNPNEAPAFVCATAVPLLKGMPSKAYCQSQVFPNYFTTVQAYATGGAYCDNPELEAQLLGLLVPQACAQLDVYTEGVILDDFTGTITVYGHATLGAAVRLQAIEYTGPRPEEGTEDQGAINEFVAAVKEEGNKLIDLTLVGPFSYGDCGLTLPVATVNGLEFLYFFADTVAGSTPFEIACLSEGVEQYSCDAPVVYPGVEVVSGGCGAITVSYDPPAEALPAGASVVIATATDENGNTATCEFTANRTIGFDGFFAPINGQGGSCIDPLRTVKGGNKIPIKFALVCNGVEAVVSEPPTFEIRNCAGELIQSGVFQLVSHIWHANFESSGIPVDQVYEIIANLPDGTARNAFLRLR